MVGRTVCPRSHIYVPVGRIICSTVGQPQVQTESLTVPPNRRAYDPGTAFRRTLLAWDKRPWCPTDDLLENSRTVRFARRCCDGDSRNIFSVQLPSGRRWHDPAIT